MEVWKTDCIVMVVELEEEESPPMSIPSMFWCGLVELETRGGLVEVSCRLCRRVLNGCRKSSGGPS
jgi:hypothetical protein